MLVEQQNEGTLTIAVPPAGLELLIFGRIYLRDKMFYLV